MMDSHVRTCVISLFRVDLLELVVVQSVDLASKGGDKIQHEECNK